MRLFIAINFEEAIRDSMAGTMEALQRHGVTGSFPEKENIHLTLVFIGEGGPAEQAKIEGVMKQVRVPPFNMTIQGFGRFPRRGGDICWLGIEPCEPLQWLHKQLQDGLKSAGFSLESQEYKPHLTLGRKVILPKDFDLFAFSRGIRPLTVEVREFSLMQSLHIQDALRYRPLFTQRLSVQ